MAVPTNVNIKQLNQIEEIVKGNFLIVETNKGTQILDFGNFVAGPDNVSFYNDFASLCGQVVALSAYVGTFVDQLSSSVDITTENQITNLSAAVDEKYNQVFYTSGTLDILSNEIVSNAVPIQVPGNISLQPSDINLTFLTTVVTALTTVPVAVYPELFGSAPNYALQVTITQPPVNVVTVGYNIFKQY